MIVFKVFLKIFLKIDEIILNEIFHLALTLLISVNKMNEIRVHTRDQETEELIN